MNHFYPAGRRVGRAKVQRWRMCTHEAAHSLAFSILCHVPSVPRIFMSGGECGHRRITLLKEGLVAAATAQWAEMLLSNAFPPLEGEQGRAVAGRGARQGEDKSGCTGGRPSDAAKEAQAKMEKATAPLERAVEEAAQAAGTLAMEPAIRSRDHLMRTRTSPGGRIQSSSPGFMAASRCLKSCRTCSISPRSWDASASLP